MREIDRDYRLTSSGLKIKGMNDAVLGIVKHDGFECHSIHVVNLKLIKFTNLQTKSKYNVN